jgi:hypothetical protein
MHPPGHEKATGQGGNLLTRTSKKHPATSASQLQEEIWPGNVSKLRSLGVSFTWRRAEHDLRLACPHCDGVLTLHESEPWHVCLGITCPAHLFKFDEIVAALKAGKP